MSPTKPLSRAATALVAAAFVLTAGSAASAHADSFTANVGGAGIGPLAVPGVSAGPSGVDLGVFRVPVPAPAH
ncbi:hypothetical protein [Rhodococcus olei]